MVNWETQKLLNEGKKNEVIKNAFLAFILSYGFVVCIAIPFAFFGDMVLLDTFSFFHALLASSVMGVIFGTMMVIENIFW